MTNFLTSLFLLQSGLADFSFSKNKSAASPRQIIIFLVAIIGLVIVVIIINNSRKGTSNTKGGAKAAPGPKRLFSIFTMHRISKNLGLNHEQSKMLTFVFKLDAVADPEKSANSPALLDRHFRRAYRVIEQTSGSDEEAQNRLAVLFSTRNRLENTSSGGFASTKQLNDETSVVFTIGKEKHNVHVVSAKGENLAVECPKTVLGSQVKLPRGEKITVLVFTKNNKGFSFETKIVGYSTTHGHPTILLAHSNQMKLLSQRRFRRRQTLIACFINMVYVEGSGKKQKLKVDKRRISGNIADISVGGCSIKTTAAVQGGVRIKLEYTQGDKNVAALGQVLRTNRTGMNTIAHVKFLKVSRKSMNLINAYVYEYVNE